MITATLADDGVSAFSAELARTQALPGHRVLLVDTLSWLQRGNGAASLDEALAAKDPAEAFAEHGAEPLLILRRSGEGGGHSADLQGIQRLLASARSRFDLILVAAAPASLSADTVALGRSADATVHLVRWGRTPQREVAAAIAQLRTGGVHVNGIVLTDVDATGDAMPPAWPQAQMKRAAALWAPHLRRAMPERMKQLGSDALLPVRDIWKRRTDLVSLVARIRAKEASSK
jgi:hypothetical protein